MTDAIARLRALGFGDDDARVLARHFLDADARGKTGHGTARIDWLATLPGLDSRARPVRIVREDGYERWESRGAVGYLTLEAICEAQIASPPAHARVVVAPDCAPTGVLGYWVRRLADGGLCAVMTATSPLRLGHPDGGPPLAGTNPIAIAIPSSDGRPLVADVSMAKATHGDVIAGRAEASDLVPFGGPQAHKAFALAVGLQALADALAGPGATGEGSGHALLLVARPSADPVPALRDLAVGVRLPGDG